MRRLLLVGCLLLAAAAPEPAGYWQGPTKGAVPDTLTGGTVIHAAGLAALLQRGRVVLIDVAPAPRRPAGMAPGAPWLPLAHQSIPGSVWVPDAGLGTLTPAQDAAFADRLDMLSGHDLRRPIVIYCHPMCWLSWNAARRAIAHGYRKVIWFPDGVEGWMKAGNTTEPPRRQIALDTPTTP